MSAVLYFRPVWHWGGHDEPWHRHVASGFDEESALCGQAWPKVLNGGVFVTTRSRPDSNVHADCDAVAERIAEKLR